MPDADRLTAREIADRLGIQPSDWRARVSREYAPQATGYATIDGAMRAYWSREVFDAYLAARAERMGVTAPNPSGGEV